METRIQGFVDVTLSFSDDGHPDIPDPPTDTTPCGSCSYNATTKWLYGVCSATFEGYPVTEFTIKLIDNDENVLTTQTGLHFTDILTGQVSLTGKARNVMSQSITTTHTSDVDAVILSWRNAAGQIISHQMTAIH